SRVENYVSSSCTYELNRSGSETSIVSGGTSAGEMVINYFNDALPPALRQPQEALIGRVARAYLVNGVTDRTILGTVTGDDSCGGTSYESNIGAWLLTRDDASQSPVVAADGHLRGTYVANKPGDTFKDTFTWDLTPLR